MKVLSVKVDEITKSCGECCMMKYVRDTYPQCCALPDKISEIAGSPYDMKYRRHDYPLEHENEVVSCE